MSIQPIDLQTLFVKMHHVGKEQAAHKDSIILQQAVQGNELVKKHQHDDSSVNKTMNSDEGPETVKEEGTGNNSQPGEQKGKKEGRLSYKDREILFDPDLGKNIDFSG